jgi:hypothetical protein
VTLNKDKNVAVMMTKSGCNKFTAFATTVASLEPKLCCFLATGAPELPNAATVTDKEMSPTEDESTPVEEAPTN